MRKRKRRLEMKIGLLSVVLSLCLAVSIQAVGFDCRKATTKIEMMICADTDLTKLDERLNKVYGETLKKSSNSIGLKKGQRQWLKERNHCVDTECLREQYNQRLASFNMDVPVYATIPPPDMSKFKVDCSKAVSTAEMIICEQAGFSQHQRWLIERDEKMRSALQWALMRTKDKQQLIESQREWVEKVRNSCTDIASCMIVYEERNLELANMMERQGSCYTLKPLSDGDGHIQLDEQGNIPPIEPVCQAMEENLNHFCGQPPMACSLKVAPRFQGQITFPDWEPLDLKANFALIEEFIRAPWENSTVKGASQRIWESERPKVQAGLAAKRLIISKAQLDLYNLGKKQSAYRLDFGTCKTDNPQLAANQTQWRESITPSRVVIQQAPEVVRQLFQKYDPIEHSGTTEAFFYEGQTYSYLMGYNGPGKNLLSIKRPERWINPAGDQTTKVHLRMKSICFFDYQPTNEDEK